MILTVTLNPLIELRHYLGDTESGEVNRVDKTLLRCGGKGINVSRQLKYLNDENLCFTLLGGENGKKFRHQMGSENLNASYFSVKSETRAASVVVETVKKRATHFINNNFKITESESDKVKDKLNKLISNSSIIVFSGSSPCKEADDIFEYGIELANKQDKISIVDTYGNHYERCINFSPTMIHNNVTEIENTTGISLRSNDERIKFLNNLYLKNIKYAFITDNEKPSFASKYDFLYSAKPIDVKEYDSAGSGDAFTAGVAHGINHSYSFSEMFKFATALGSLNAESERTCEVSGEVIEKILNNVSVSEIGKKTKLIDDSSTI